MNKILIALAVILGGCTNNPYNTSYNTNASYNSDNNAPLKIGAILGNAINIGIGKTFRKGKITTDITENIGSNGSTTNIKTRGKSKNFSTSLGLNFPFK